MVETLYAGRRCRPAKNLRYWTKCAFLRIIYSVSILSLGCVKILWGDAPSSVPFSAFIVDEIYIFVCRYVEPFRSYALPNDGGSAEGQRNLRFPPSNF